MHRMSIWDVSAQHFMYLSLWRKVRGGANDAIFSDCFDPKGTRKGNSIGGAILSENVNLPI